jgi:nitrogen regulatory protein P-II 1
MYLLFMVLDDVTRRNEVLVAWMGAGVSGVTILESTGVNRVLPRRSAEPMFAGFSQMFGSGRVGHNTLFAVIESIEVAEAAVQATEAILGNLNQPHTGIIFLVPVVKTWGMPEPYAG